MTELVELGVEWAHPLRALPGTGTEMELAAGAQQEDWKPELAQQSHSQRRSGPHPIFAVRTKYKSCSRKSSSLGSAELISRD